MQLSAIVSELDDRLSTDAYADIDASANGLQVGPESADIDHVAVAVDAAAATIESAAAVDADLLVVHHGISWGGIERITERSYDLVAALIENDIALYVSHLPLDGHQQLGNAAGVADAIGLAPEGREPFGSVGSECIGTIGESATPISQAALCERLDDFDHGGQSTQVLPFGPDDIERVAIVTGSGVDWLGEAIEAGADALVTGEGKQQAYHQAREAGISVFLAGHYATETFGVRALQSHLEGRGLDTTFIDHPTGL